MSTVSLTTPASATLLGDTTPKPKDAADAAKQFEAMLLSQMLRTGHEEEDDSLGEKDPTGDTMWDMAAQQFSQMLAKNGGVGLAKLITQKLPSR
jgi:Rod binding domain-containing protein